MRPFGLISSALVLFSIAPRPLGPAAPLSAPSPAAILVTVGEAAPDRAALWVRAEGHEPLRLSYGPADHSTPRGEAELEPDPARDWTARLTLTELRPGTRYRYTVSRDADWVDGDFTTAPASDADAAVRLVWSGDLGGKGHCRGVEDGYRVFWAMSERRPDFFLFVGDTMYADHVCAGGAPGADLIASSLAEFHAKHRHNRADPLLQQFFRTTTVYAVWDDHEVRNNFSGPHEPLMPVGRQAFLDYWPIAGPSEEPYRLYRSVRWGRHVEVFILDTRQYRSSNWMRDGPDKTMLGEAQRRWLLAALSASQATWKLIVNSVPLGMFTGGPASDSWSNANILGFPRRGGTGFVHERDRLLRALHDRGIANVVFVGGEVHHAELVRHEPLPGFVVHEFVAGPLAARKGYRRPLDRGLGSRSLGSLGWANNFGEIVADGNGLRVRIVDAEGATRVSLRLPAGHERIAPVTAQAPAPPASTSRPTRAGRPH